MSSSEHPGQRAEDHGFQIVLPLLCGAYPGIPRDAMMQNILEGETTVGCGREGASSPLASQAPS